MNWSRLATLVLVVVFMVQLSTPATNMGGYTDEATPVIPSEPGSASSAGFGGEEPVITNVIPYGDMETSLYDNTPYGWSYYGTSYQYGDRVYSGDSASGTYSGRLIGRSSNAYGAQPYLQADLSDSRYLSDGAFLEFDWKVVANTGKENYVRTYMFVQLYDGSNHFYIYYYLSYGTSFYQSNYSSQAVYMLGDSEYEWHGESRNVTADFATPENPYNPDDNWQIQALMLYLAVPNGGYEAEMLIDNVWLTDDLDGYYNSNGDFETGMGNGWYTYQSDPSYLAMTGDATQGAKAVNMSLPAGRAMIQCSQNFYWWLGYPNGFYATGPGTLTISFDYKYSGGRNDGGSYAQFVVVSQNDTRYNQALWMLGQSDDSNSPSNGSEYTFFNATGFGIRDVWHHVEIDVFDLYSELGLVNVTISDIQFQMQRGILANASQQLLVDNFCVVTYPAGDPGFEQDFRTDYWIQLTGWRTDSGFGSQISYSSDAHSGDHSARLNPDYSSTARLYRPGSLDIDAGTYTDFWWKLVGPMNGTAAAIVTLRFNLGQEVRYIVGRNGAAFSNDTWTAFYTVENAGVVGTWNNLARNVYDDVLGYFGRTDLVLEMIAVQAWTEGVSEIEVLFDDMHFIYDTTPPVVTIISQTPFVPVYHSSTVVSIDAADNLALDTVALSYRVGTGSWTELPASEVAGHFEAEIPAFPYGTQIEYIAHAGDRRGNTGYSSTDGFAVGDDVKPEAAILSPLTGTTVGGTIIIEIDASDPDAGSSGIDYFLLFDGGNLLTNQSYGDPTVSWNTRLAPNGTHALTAIVYDLAGNTDSATTTVFLDNDFVPPKYSEIHLTPAAPEYDESVTVALSITDSSEVTSALLYYRFGSGPWLNLSMASSYSLYTGTIPGASWNTHVYYYVSMADSFGYTASVGSALDPFTYTVGDSVAPVLSVSGPPSSVPLEGEVELNLLADDAGSGMWFTEFLLDGTFLAEVTESPSTYIWDTAEVANGEHTVTAIAHDVAGNTVALEFTYTIHNPEGLEPLFRSLTSIWTEYGLVMGVASGIILIVIAKLLVRRRSS